MLYSSVLLVATAFSGIASAQSSSCVGPSGRTLANPGQVDASTRAGWCIAERNTCPLICGSDGTTGNDCDPTMLTYSCVCRSGATPNISDYAQTLPSAICQSDIDLCIAANPNDATCQANCRTITCGDKNASAISASSTTSSASSTASATGSASSSASGSASATASSASASASASKAAAVVGVARDFGTPALLAGLFAIFGFLA